MYLIYVCILDFRGSRYKIFHDQIMKGFHCLKNVNEKDSISGFDSVPINKIDCKS